MEELTEKINATTYPSTIVHDHNSVHTHVQNRELIASMKSEIRAIKGYIDKLITNIDKLNIDMTEMRTKQTFIINDIDMLKQFTNNAKSITESVTALKNGFNKLENSIASHVDISNGNFSKINHDIVEIRSQLHHLPSMYETKSSKSIGEYIKMAPGIIAIITVILSGLVLYLKDIL